MHVIRRRLEQPSVPPRRRTWRPETSAPVQRLFRSLAGPRAAAAEHSIEEGAGSPRFGAKERVRPSRNDGGLLLRFRSIPPIPAKAQVRGGLSVLSRRPAPGTCPRIPHAPDLDNPTRRRFRRSGGAAKGAPRCDRPTQIDTPPPYVAKGLDQQKRRSEALSTRWQVQDSNLRRHTPTDLQNDAAHAVTCRFVAPASNFGRYSPRFRAGDLWFPPNRGGLPYAASRSGAAVFS
jgi:hypothetical protein